MRSLIILEVEHGEDTDSFAELARYLFSEAGAAGRNELPATSLANYTVRYDLPKSFKLENFNAHQ